MWGVVWLGVSAAAGYGVWCRGAASALEGARFRRLFWYGAALAVLLGGWWAGTLLMAAAAAVVLWGAGIADRTFRPSIHAAGWAFLVVRVWMAAGVSSVTVGVAAAALLVMTQRVGCGRHSLWEGLAGIGIGGLVGWLTVPIG